ncbi:hypothetical protein ACNAQI_14560 [Pseudomonas aeruginosa]|uniref:hypothetical protein n=2 Tax=Pseudomonas aeruginosa TaxID=287 RepID=UPI003A4D2946
MTKANECTCPSGDGSLRHPCPAHPASVELAGVAAKLTFINGRPAMCGCQVEYSSGGGEYSDVIYVTLCAKHSGSAILDLVATNRIALTPEYEGQWHADLYLDREIPLAKAEGATPAEAVLALMSAERIDPEQGGVDQAGGDRWDALQSIMEWTAAENIPDDRKLCLIRNAARAALAQPSPASDLDPLNLAPHAEAFNEAPAEALKPGQAEAERPEVVAWRYGFSGGIVSDKACLDEWKSGGEYQSLMTVAQHERIVGALRAERDGAIKLLGQSVWQKIERLTQERDAALARVEQQERTIAGINEAHAKLAGLYEAAQAQHSAGYAEARQCVNCRHIGINDAADYAACHDCRWTGPEPDEDKCPGCAGENCMAAACPECGGRYELVAEAKISTPAAQAGQMPQAWLDVQAERRRQITAEGWTPEHDDEHSHGQIARAAACYALAGSSAPNDGTAALLVSLAWPWDQQWWKPTSARRDLIKAGALILAEIERLDRAAPGKEVGHE